MMQVTFGAGRESYAALPKLDTHGDMQLEFMFKTTEENGMHLLCSETTKCQQFLFQREFSAMLEH